MYHPISSTTYMASTVFYCTALGQSHVGQDSKLEFMQPPYGNNWFCIFPCSVATPKVCQIEKMGRRKILFVKNKNKKLLNTY